MKVKFVDGFLIRNTTNDGFGSLHKHGTKVLNFADRYYIPQDEIWIDVIYRDSGEVEFLLKMDELTDKYIEENPNGDYREFAKSFCEKGEAPDFYKKKEKIDGLIVAYVDGAIIRKYFDPEFVMGGHEFVYNYIPQGEIWIDNWLNPKEFPYILIHEQVERKLMSEGKNYDNAHEYANAAEKELRDIDGIGNFPGFENFTWKALSNEEVFKHYYV